jgi:hypothetical protein
MDPLAALAEKLKDHPELVSRNIPGGLRIEPPCQTGFGIELNADAHGWTVWLGNAGFHDDFTSADEVLEFVSWCYSGAARVREVWRGSVPQKSVLEACEVGEWHEVATTEFIFVPFWRKRNGSDLAQPRAVAPGLTAHRHPALP